MRAKLLNNHNGQPAVSCKSEGGKKGVRMLPMPYENYSACVEKMKQGLSVERAFPSLGPDDHEFLMTGLTPSDWYLGFIGGDEEDVAKDHEKSTRVWPLLFEHQAVLPRLRRTDSTGRGYCAQQKEN